MFYAHFSASRKILLLILFIVALGTDALAGPAPNSDAIYQQLRNISLSGESVSVNNLVLKREGGTFRLRSGTFCFVSPVQGRVTGAVFIGDGTLVIDPPLP